MAKTYAITDQKGGVGKTFLTINLAASAAKSGKMVLAVDLDPQGHLTEGTGLAEAYLSDDISLFDALVPDPRRKEPIILGDLIKKAPNDDFYVLPANYMMQAAEKDLYGENGREKLVDALLEQLEDAFDEFYLDAPPNLGPLTDCALYAARRGHGGLVVPVQADKSSIKALELLTDQREMLEKQITDETGKIWIDCLAIVPNLYRPSTITNDILKLMRASFSDTVTEFVIPTKIIVPEAYDQGHSLYSYEPKFGDKTQKRADAIEMQVIFDQIITRIRKAVGS